MEGGKGVSQMPILQNKALFSIMADNGGRMGQKCPKNFLHGLWMTPFIKIHGNF